MQKEGERTSVEQRPLDLSIYAALERASIREHQWSMGEREHQPINYDRAHIDWTLKGFGSWLSREVRAKISEIRRYIYQNHSTELVPQLSAAELHQLVGYR